ncbi:hypothetical protein [Granulosicoccus antarcticus]|uniref:Uncharacterized protein n=1 Tax=Granulosicoccus antarcticus IMCC3135 TaxID=1192854 RepID=A0A2Z2NKJ5_9GAMM|nr:hypothetical protein [Granulosicoccus antarcticus]ASJ70531.1 hypothetical protein IMCC3135_02085 [Granulosicoccus antarcticus IMCC3135]
MRHIRTVAHAASLLLLVCALVAPKVSLALVSVFGTGSTSVLICSDGGLKRVTIAADGEIIADDSEANAWVSPHCALPDARTAEFVRTWQHVRYPQLTAIAMSHSVDRLWSPTLVRPDILSRGPPAL